MITIKRDRGWENPQSWSDVEFLPGYVKNVDPKTAVLDAVIGKYREPDLRVCGLSNCHRKHYRGYIVTTKDGRVTNIGVDCGRNHFGVDFDTLSRQLDRDWENQERREAVSAAQNRLDGWKETCNSLLSGERGASWLNKEYIAVMDKEKGLSPRIARVVTDLMKTGGSTLFKERQATAREKEMARGTGQRVQEIIREEVGTLRGVTGLAGIDELRELLPKDLEPNLKALGEFDVTHCKDQELRFWSKWCGEVDTKLSRVSAIIAEARRFFAKDNISQLAELSEDRDEEKAVMAVAKRYS